MTFVSSEKEYASMLSALSTYRWVVVDTETSGLEAWKTDRLCAIGLGNTTRQFFIDTRENDFDLTRLWSVLQTVSIIVGHNIKFDLTFLAKEGFDVLSNQKLHDTLVMERLLVYERFPDLGLTDSIVKFVSARDADYDRQFKSLLKKNRHKTYDKASNRNLGIYCMNDVYYEALLYQKFSEALACRNLTSIWKHEIDITEVTWRMEQRGIHVDLDYCNYASKLLAAKAEKIEGELNEMAGGELNLDSNKQLSEFFKSQKVKSPVRTKNGKESWGEGALLTLDHPAAKKIKEYRSISKLNNTYFADYRSRGEFLHPVLKNWGTVTGRYSCSDPNVQNLPKIKIPIIDIDNSKTDPALEALVRDLIAARRGSNKESTLSNTSGSYGSWLSLISKKFDETNEISVRRAIIPRPGNVLLGFDFSQMELRVLFAYLNNAFVDKYLDDRKWDGHSWVANVVWGKTEEDPNFKFYRGLAKAINFGIMYGSGDALLATQIQKTKEEAAQFRKEYYSKIPGLDAFMKKLKSVLLTRGYVFNRFGRQYSVTSDRLYVLVNYLVQGTSADIVKNRMIALERYTETHPEFGVSQIMQVHDEVVIECKAEEYIINTVVQDVTSILEEPIFRKSLPVDTSVYYPSYAHKLDYLEDDWKRLIHVLS